MAFNPDPKPIPKVKSKPKQIGFRSKKRASQEREYKSLRDIWIVGKKCKRCKSVATECHHMKGRIGRLLLDIKFWLPVCSECHKHIELNPIEAKEKGWSLNRL